MTEPLVSLVVATYNYGRYLPETIESILKQSYKNLEIIVVDDGSTDNTRQVVKQYPVRYIYQENHGPSYAFNVGIRISHGRFYITPGADDKLHPDYVALCVKEMLKNDSVGFVWTGAQEFGLTYELRSPNPLHNTLSIYRGPGGQLGAALFRRKAFEDVGGYDETLTVYEDWDIAIRMLKRGWKGCPIMLPLYFWRRHGVSRNTRAERDKLLKVLEKKYPHLKLYNRLARFQDFFVLCFSDPGELCNRLLQKFRKTQSKLKQYSLGR
ncbi:MAG: glycosyltransferase family 2 protein [Candidatus Bathyarchaeia archaeon]|jgi:glycosyltransferase involved in cell wall biosynthesis